MRQAASSNHHRPRGRAVVRSIERQPISSRSQLFPTMSEPTQSESTESNQFTVGVFLTGALVENRANLADPQALGEEVASELSKIAMAEQRSIDTVVLVDAAEEIVDAVDAQIDASVEFVPRFDFRGMLNDEGEDDLVQAVMGEDQETVPRHIDDPNLWNDDHKNAIDWGEIDQERVDRAKEKALLKRVERLTNDYFEDDPTLDEALIVKDTTSGVSEEARLIQDAMDGENAYVKYPTDGPDPSTMTPSIGVLWAEVLLEQDEFEPSDLSEEQIDDLLEYRSDANEQLQAAGGPSAEASGAGAAAPADD